MSVSAADFWHDQTYDVVRSARVLPLRAWRAETQQRQRETQECRSRQDGTCPFSLFWLVFSFQLCGEEEAQKVCRTDNVA